MEINFSVIFSIYEFFSNYQIDGFETLSKFIYDWQTLFLIINSSYKSYLKNFEVGLRNFNFTTIPDPLEFQNQIPQINLKSNKIKNLEPTLSNKKTHRDAINYIVSSKLSPRVDGYILPREGIKSIESWFSMLSTGLCKRRPSFALIYRPIDKKKSRFLESTQKKKIFHISSNYNLPFFKSNFMNHDKNVLERNSSNEFRFSKLNQNRDFSDEFYQRKSRNSFSVDKAIINNLYKIDQFGMHNFYKEKKINIESLDSFISKKYINYLFFTYHLSYWHSN